MTSTDNRGKYAVPLLRRLADNLSTGSNLLATEPTKSNPVADSPPKKNQPASGGTTNWKVFVFFLPGSNGNPKPPKLPDGKDWLDLLLMLLKVAGAIYALVKAVGVLG